ncbi:MAG: hypothetical protein GQ574_26055 [Crocinitomix sp.]|nr:hypothetical protein [Crocinitomix sp.]
MSVNLNISFEIHNIKEIHSQKDEIKRDEIFEAANKFLAEVGILSQGMIVDFLGQDGNLVGYTTSPIIISRSHLWVPDVTKKWKEMAIRIMGTSCKPFVAVEYPDEEMEDDYEDEEMTSVISEEKMPTNKKNEAKSVLPDSPGPKPWWKFW